MCCFQRLVSMCLHGSCKGRHQNVFQPTCLSFLFIDLNVALSSPLSSPPHRSASASISISRFSPNVCFPQAFRCLVVACEHKQGEDWEDQIRKFRNGKEWKGMERNGSVLFSRKFRKSRPPFDFLRLDWSDLNRPFHLTIPTRSHNLKVIRVKLIRMKQLAQSKSLSSSNSSNSDPTSTIFNEHEILFVSVMERDLPCADGSETYLPTRNF